MRDLVNFEINHTEKSFKLLTVTADESMEQFINFMVMEPDSSIKIKAEAWKVAEDASISVSGRDMATVYTKYDFYEPYYKFKILKEKSDMAEFVTNALFFPFFTNKKDYIEEICMQLVDIKGDYLITHYFSMCKMTLYEPGEYEPDSKDKQTVMQVFYNDREESFKLLSQLAEDRNRFENLQLSEGYWIDGFEEYGLTMDDDFEIDITCPEFKPVTATINRVNY